MRNVFRMFAIAMMMATLFSCEKAEGLWRSEGKDEAKVNEEATAGTMTFTADFVGSKTGFNDGWLTWEVNDQIAICDGTNVEVVTLTAEDIIKDGAAANFTTKTLATDAAEYYAVFPASCAYEEVDRSKGALETFVLEDGRIQVCGNDVLDKSYTFRSYAVSSDELHHFMFMNVDAMVCFKTELTDIASVVFKINGSGLVASDAQIDPLTKKIDHNGYHGAHSVKYVLNGDTEAFIPVCAGFTLYGGYTLTAYDKSENVIGTISTSSDLTFEHGKYYNIKNFDSRLVGALPGKFTINRNGDYVHFAPGNLYWNGEAFRFESNQTDWCSPKEPVEGGDTHVSHFFWSKSEDEARAGLYDDDEASTDDVLFTNVSGFEANGQKDVWRALSSDELTYILGTTSMEDETQHRDADKRFAAAKVNDVDGLLIFPDGFRWTESMGKEPEAYNVMPVIEVEEEVYKVEYEKNTYAGANFTAMEKAGVVFLPAAGNYEWSPEYFDRSTGFGWYWSSDPIRNDSARAHSFFFGNEFHPDGEDNREYGFPIRLVTDCE